MSVTASPANVEPPPLLFGQRSPSPFSSIPRSPTTSHNQRTEMATIPPTDDDIDMSTSTTIHRPNGQNHDRQDAEMSGAEDTMGSPPPEDDFSESNNSDDESEDTMPNEEDAMDTTPDPPEAEDLADTATNSSVIGPSDATSASQNGTIPPVSEIPDQTAAAANLVTFISPSASVDSSQDEPIEVPRIGEMESNDPPPPPAPPIERAAEVRDEELSDEENAFCWQPNPEDPSTPDERELKDIEANLEHSALEHEYWEKKTFTDMFDPEYVPRASGRIEWTVPNYNGTKERPNKELVMRSPVVSIGGYDWQIKFYPKGNDTDNLSIYIDCLSVTSEETKPGSASVERPEKSISDESGQTSILQAQFAPLPLLDTRPPPKRPSVAAQASVVLYNPQEPRVHCFRSCTHRYCPGSADWGWTRYHSIWDTYHRLHGQRQALLRNDTLSFTAYIRIIEDETGCLWEHDTGNGKNSWNSFAMTGLQSLTCRAYTPGGNLISAVSTWMLLKPFRDFLSQVVIPEEIPGVYERPKPLIAALQKVLYKMRTQVQPKDRKVDLYEISSALSDYGIYKMKIEGMDVIELWELLRTKIEQELEGTCAADAFQDIFGEPRSYAEPSPTYRIPVKGVNSVQKAVDEAKNMLSVTQNLPQVLTLELERQNFDSSTRTWKKLTSNVKIDESIVVRGTSFTLFGLVAHTGDTQSGLYKSVLRPNGPEGKWYTYQDSREDYKVICLTKRQAINAHEGTTAKAPNATVAYIVLYIRDDIARSVFTADESPWNVPNWITHDGWNDINRKSGHAYTLHSQDDEHPLFTVVDSRVFLKHEGPGAFDIYDPKWKPGVSEFIYSIDLDPEDTSETVETKLACEIRGVVDPRQIKFWILRPTIRPGFRSNITNCPSDRDKKSDWTLSDWDFGAGNPQWFIWVYVIDKADLPELPVQKNAYTSNVADSSSDLEQSNVPPPAAATQLVGEGTIIVSEDTPMSDHEDNRETHRTVPPPVRVEIIHTGNGETAELFAAPVRDADMTDALIAIPPPPPAAASNDNVPPPPMALTIPPPPPSTDVYFFLKFFNYEHQRLESRGFHAAKKTASLSATILKILDVPPDTRLTVELEDGEQFHPTIEIGSPQRSFEDLRVKDLCIFIAAPNLTSSQRDELRVRGCFSDPGAHILARRHDLNFPAVANGHFSFARYGGESYTGEIKNHMMHGHATRIYHSGDSYTGNFVLGSREGYGTMTYQNGDTYTGEWKVEEQHGQGTYVEAASGNTYVGGWRAGKKYGKGTTHWKNAQEAERTCRICYEQGADAAFYDCGHVVACLACARRVDVCPVCRKRVLSCMKLYYAN